MSSARTVSLMPAKHWTRRRLTSKLTGLQRLGVEGAQFMCAWSAQPLQVRLNAQLGVARAEAGNWRTETLRNESQHENKEGGGLLDRGRLALMTNRS